MKWLIQRLFGAPISRYFRPGVQYAVKIPSAFAREIALEQAMDYVRQCQVEGDYTEFGVWKGRTFAAACHLARERNLRIRLWAFDSFEGLPGGEGEFASGAYRSSQELFLGNVRRCIGDLSDVRVVPGWFSESLAGNRAELSELTTVSVAWVDCDLYESTKPVLEFLTPRLQDGSLIFFDDWFCFKGHPDCGEQRACREWLEANSDISLSEYSRFGWHGKSFIVRRAL